MTLPSDLSGLGGWWKADALTGLSDGDPVPTWADSSGNSRTMSQSISGFRPIYKTGILNSKPVVRFDGADDVLEADLAAAGLATGTFIVVARSTSGTGIQGILNADDTGASQGGRYFQLRLNSASQAAFLGFNNANSAFVDTQTVSGSGTSTWNAITGVRDTASVQAYVNGTSDGSTASSGTNQVTSGIWLLNIGNATGRTSPSSYLTGDVAEVIWFNRVLTTGERAQMHSYIQDKYGIAVSDYLTSNSGTAALSSSGTLITGGTPAIPGNLTFNGYPDYSGGYTGGGLNGSGTLTASGTVPQVGTATLTGSGTLTLTGVPAPAASLPLTGVGALTFILPPPRKRYLTIRPRTR